MGGVGFGRRSRQAYYVRLRVVSFPPAGVDGQTSSSCIMRGRFLIRIDLLKTINRSTYLRCHVLFSPLSLFRGGSSDRLFSSWNVNETLRCPRGRPRTRICLTTSPCPTYGTERRQTTTVAATVYWWLGKASQFEAVG